MMLDKYRRWYDAMMARAAHRPMPAGYCERHHVVPRAMGGSDDAGNIVALTYREHFLAHWLLTKFTTGSGRRKMLHALYRMSGKFEGRVIASWRYDVSRKAQREAKRGTKQTAEANAKRAAKLKGNKNSLGVKHGPEMRRKNSERLRGNKHSLGHKHSAKTLAKRGAFSEATKAKMTAAQLRRWASRTDRTVSDETRQRMSVAAKRREPRSEETRAKLSASTKAAWDKRRGIQ